MAFEKVAIKYDGRYEEAVLSELDLANPGSPTDSELKTALAVELDSRGFDSPDLSGYVVDPPENERVDSDLTILQIRPSATYAKEQS